MSGVQEFYLKNMRDDEGTAMKKATNDWTECISRDFLPKWQAGEEININEVCLDERS